MYINRDNEIKNINKFINDGVKIIYIDVEENSGFSAFLQERFKDFKTYHIIYENRTCESLSEKLLSIMSPEDIKNIMKSANAKYGGYDKKFLSFLSNQFIPYIGDFLSTLNEGKKGLNFLNSNIEILSSSIMEYFKNISNKQKIGILIDKAQYLNESDFDFIKRLSSIKNVYIIVAYSSKAEDICKMKLKLDSVKCEELYFNHPNTHIVIELAKYFNQEVNREEAKQILVANEYDIHKIIYYLKSDKNIMSFTSLNKAIISIIFICNNEIDNQELIKLINYDKNILSKDNEINCAINDLCECGILRKQNSKLYLYAEYPAIKDIIHSHANILYYKNLILNYYNDINETSVHIAELCYKISNEINIDNEKWLKFILLYKMKYNLPFEKSLVQNVNNKKLQIIAYTYLRLYKDAEIKIKEVNKKECLDKDFRELYAVILNRCRKHRKAKKKLLECLSEDKDNYILKAYLVSNYIHSEKLEKAQKIYFAEQLNLNNIDQAYFFRNCGAAFWDNLEPFEQALQIFEQNQEWFGFYSTKCNLITRKMMLDLNKSQSLEFQIIEKELEKFGDNNMHIFYNNWAIAELLNKNYSQAHKLLNIAYAYSHSKMPEIFITINSACLLIRENKLSEALNIIDSIEHDVEEIPVERVRQKYYLNKAFIYYCNNKLNSEILDKCNQYTDRYNKNLTYKKIKFYKKRLLNNTTYTKEDFLRCYCPCYLEYWYINPLKLLSVETIDEILSI